MTEWLLPLMAFLPIAASVPLYAIGRGNKRARDAFFLAIVILTAALSAFGLSIALGGREIDWRWEGFCGLGLHLRLDGFRALYAAIAAVMWLGTGLFSREYFAAHYRNRNRYYFFTLLTLGSTMGVFLSASLYSAFVFFEVMSLSSYAWVAHDETEGALRAAQTYLAVAIIGGMATLMGLFLLYARIGTLEIDEIYAACSGLADRGGLYLAGALIASGFAAKAGAFPAHIWLPKAHPVAPAPASALLSGILTKTGVFGVIVVTCDILPGDALWGNALLLLGVITMLLGAVLALFSVNLKRTLACSSMSQIGFILVGLSMRCLLGEEGGLASYGTVMHMANHSMIKLTLFLCAGAVYMRLHKLDLNDVRGFGRNRPALHIAFLLGAMGIMGVPMLNGYVSKSLIHESILEYAALAPESSRYVYQIAEKLFLLAGGMTAAYMTKLYVCLFIEKNADPEKQKAFAEKKRFSPLTNAVLLGSALILLAMGLFPEAILGRAANLSLPFLRAEAPGHIAYFSGENLKGAAISLAIGAILYFGLIRAFLMRKDERGARAYVDRWPKWLDLEEMLYRPLLEKILPCVCGWVCAMLDGLFDFLMRRDMLPLIAGKLCEAMDGLFEFVLGRVIKPVVYFLTRAADEASDAGAVLLMNTVFRSPKPKLPAPVGSRFTYGLGAFLNACVSVLNKTVRRKRPIGTDFIAVFAAGAEEMRDTLRRVTRSVSFGLLLLCVCMYAIFAYLLSR